MKYEVSFISSVGNDQYGWNLISDLIRRNVDVSGFAVEDGKFTNETIVLEDKKGARSLIGISPELALSITTPAQVPWNKFEKARVVYIGEVFVEVAATISAYAKSNDIPVVYRCSVPFLERGLDQLESILSQIDVLLLSQNAWSYLKNKYSENPVKEIRQISGATIVVRDTSTSYTIYHTDGEETTHSTKSFLSDISETFTANLVIALSEGRSHKEAITKAIKSEKN
jgi:sugar/nucleoside kinase (ribokinase family)